MSVPDEYHGIKQQPMDGVSMMYSFDDANAPNRKQRQYLLQAAKELQSYVAPDINRKFTELYNVQPLTSNTRNS